MQFNVLWWDYNNDHPTPYDVLPYFRRCYESCKKKDMPVTKEQWTEFVRQKGMYRFWGDCNYEIIISQWPPKYKNVKRKNLENGSEEMIKELVSKKVDIWQQIEPNIDLIVNLLMEEYIKLDVDKLQYGQFLKSLNKKVTVKEFLDKYSKYLDDEIQNR